MNVLIIEYEKSLSKEINTFLTSQSYKCESVFSGREALEKMNFNIYEFILLDLGLPDCDGLKLLMQGKSNKLNASFIILSARGAIEDRIKGLNEGADDYLPKPFSLPELLSRMHAIKRRKFATNSNEVKFLDFCLDTLKRTLSYKELEIELTKKEFDLLNYLILNRRRVLTRIQLSEHLWGNMFEDEYDSNYIDVHIKNIRKKIGIHASVDWLETIRGVGYKANV